MNLMIKVCKSIRLIGVLLFLISCGINDQKSSMDLESLPNVVLIYADDLGYAG